MSMRLATEPYLEQNARWPKSGRHILAQFDADSIVVYQAYRPSIGRFAATHCYFGGEFSFNRMSWVKPNFLWMMYRSGWGTKQDQEITLAVRLRRTAFDAVLAAAVPSSFQSGESGSHAEWQRRVAESDVRLQWDPDHDPHGHALDRRAIQLGLRGETLAKYGREWILDIEDISAFVVQQRRNLGEGGESALITPREDVYPSVE